jgi:hypothetical protein
LTFDRLDLNSGRYLVDVGCYGSDWAYALDYQLSAHAFVVRGSSPSAILTPPCQWELLPERGVMIP